MRTEIYKRKFNINHKIIYMGYLIVSRKVLSLWETIRFPIFKNNTVDQLCGC
jgi:hypothetical protein